MDAEAESPVLWPPDARNWLIGKEPWFWERLKVGGGGDDRGWDGWITSPTQWTWVWVSSRSWWWTRKPCVLQYMGSQRVRHHWATELNWTEQGPTHQSKTQFFPSSVPPSGILHKPLSLSHHRADRRIKKQHSLTVAVQKSYYRKVIMMKKLKVM